MARSRGLPSPEEILELLKTADAKTGKRVAVAVAVGLAGFMFYPYSNFIWFKNPDIWAHLADAVVPFALLGLLSSRIH
jgi:hypothetical protein